MRPARNCNTVRSVVAILTSRLEFPHPSNATEDGLLAVGGDLSVPRLLLAYRSGIFPWPIFEEGIMTWFSPDPRAVLDLNKFHVPRSLSKRMRRGDVQTSTNRAFGEVVERCAETTTKRPSTWITREIKDAYRRLHRAGYAHSVETWHGHRLVGGLYGVAIGGFFAGESMFSLMNDASKIAVVTLVDRLRSRDFRLLDIQQSTPHMRAFGAEEIGRDDYLSRLSQAVSLDRSFEDAIVRNPSD